MKLRIGAWTFLHVLFVLGFLALLPAFAQVPPDIAMGLNPAATYSTNNFDDVDMSTGRLFMQIPLVQDKSQRGNLNFTYSLTYSNPGWVQYCDDEGDCEWYLSQTGAALGPLPILDGSLSCGPGSGYEVAAVAAVGSDGSSHPLGWMGNYYESLDGSGIQVSSDCSTLINKDGIRFVSSGAPYIEDTNGNVITMSSYEYNTAFGANLFNPAFGSWTMTDTAGRSWSFNASASTSGCPGNPTSATSWTAPGYNGANRQYTFCYGTITINPPWPNTFWYDGQEYTNPSTYQDTPLTAVVLPDGTTWQFEYGDGQGEVTEVILPTGGSVSYTYASDSRMVASRQVCDNVNPCQTWTYNISAYGGGAVTDPLGNDTVYTESNAAPDTIGEIQYYVGSASGGNWLKQVNKNYLQAGSYQVLPSGETTTLPTGQVSQWTQAYDSGFTYTWCDAFGSDCGNYTGIYGLVEETDHYDWGSGAPGPLLSQTSSSYLALSNGSYLSANLLSLVAQQSVSGSGGNSSATYFGYDQNMVGSGVGTQHGSAPTPGVLGNLTSVVQWNSNTNSNLTTQTLYVYDTGMPQHTVDANGNTSATYTYDGTGTYPTRNCNALSQCTNYTYDSNTGLVTSMTDPNNQTTSYPSYDVMLRLLQVNYPDGGQTNWSYPNPNDIAQTQVINSSLNLNKVTTSLFDGLGRLIQTQLNSDPQGTDFTDTAYDPLGHIASVSNPHRSGSSSTDGTTQYSYDALGRVISIREQDGTVVSTSYSGNCSTVTDVGVSRQYCADALSRLTGVEENPGGLNYQTNYSYDALSNLHSVSENGAGARQFTYDSLSRLIAATNPESGTVGYVYDNNGNLSARTDARGITTSYAYDALNRLLSKTYSDGTPSVTFGYDQSSVTQNGVPYPMQNTIGRLTSAQAGPWVQPWGLGVILELFSYDPMGRVNIDYQCPPSVCAYQMNYTYDQAGDVTSYLNPLWGWAYYGYNGAQWPVSVTTNWSDWQHPGTLATVDPSVGYTPTGQLQVMTLGNGLMETSIFQSRLQPCRMNVNSSGTFLGSCGDSIPSGNVQDFSLAFGSSGANNGSFTGWVATGTQNFNRSYTYDSLNRLSTMSSPNDPSGCTGLSWSYDAWGNRTAQSVTGGSCNTWSQAYNGNNQISGFQYDAAGNVTNDGVHTYSYDAENHLTAVDGGVTASYVYDAQGRRVRSLVNGAWTDYLYDLSNHVIADTEQNYWGPNYYIYLGNRLLVDYNDSNGAIAYFVHPDHLGSTRLITAYGPGGLNQQLEDSLDFLPFGEQIAGGAINPHKFTGQYRDPETGNDYFGARFYGSGMGRFLSPDPAGNLVADLTNPQSWNMYNYVLNNPLSFVDPFGLDCQNTWNNQGTEIITNCTVTSGDDGTCTQMSGTNCQQQYQQATSGPSTATIMQNLYSQEGQQPQSPGSQSRIACAANFGQNHSIAAAFGAQNSFVGNLFGGNSVSGLINLGRTVFGSAAPSGSSIAGTILSGSAQGLPVPSGHPGMSGVVGQLQGAGIQAAYGAVTGVGQETLELGISASGNVASVAAPLSETALFGVGVAKLAFDAVTVGYGYIAACH